jgi:hypothetical protein
MNLTTNKLDREYHRLSGTDSFVYYTSLFRPERRVYEAIGIYAQLAATIDLHLRRIYFALRATGENQRGPERAHLDQIMDRLPDAIQACEFDLYRKEQFAELLTEVRRHLSFRNDVIHAACRWQPDGDFLIFAHANEKAGRDIKTGEGIAYWLIPKANFLDNVHKLKQVAGFISQYSYTWLPKLRPWLQSYWDGEPDPGGSRTEAFFSQFRG